MKPAKALLTALLCLAVLLLSFFGVGLNLHGLVHADAADANHHCVISLFAHGQVDLTEAAVSVSPSVTTVTFALAAPVVVFVPLPGFCLLPERAPPILSGSFVV